MVTSAIAKLSVFEFAVAVLDHLRPNLPAEKIVQRLGLSRAAGKYENVAVVFDRAGCDRFSDAVAHARQCH